MSYEGRDEPMNAQKTGGRALRADFVLHNGKAAPRRQAPRRQPRTHVQQRRQGACRWLRPRATLVLLHLAGQGRPAEARGHRLPVSAPPRVGRCRVGHYREGRHVQLNWVHTAGDCVERKDFHPSWRH